MNWIEHLECARNCFLKEAENFRKQNNDDLANAAEKDASAIDKVIDDIENGKTQQKQSMMDH